MDLNAIGIPVAFTILSAMLLWIIIGGRGHWLIKMGLTSVTVYFALALWASTTDMIGWPTSETVPEKFEVHWLIVKEPSLGLSEEGAIYLWATELDEKNLAKIHHTHPWLMRFSSRKQDVEPRSYRLPYSRDLHEQAQKATQMIKAGQRVMGTREGMAGEEGGEGSKGGKGDVCPHCKGTGKTPAHNESESEAEHSHDGVEDCPHCDGTGEKKGKGTGGSQSKNKDNVFYILPPPVLPAK